MLRVQYLLRNHQRVVQSVEAESGVASGSILTQIGCASVACWAVNRLGLRPDHDFTRSSVSF